MRLASSWSCNIRRRVVGTLEGEHGTKSRQTADTKQWFVWFLPDSKNKAAFRFGIRTYVFSVKHSFPNKTLAPLLCSYLPRAAVAHTKG